MPTTTRQGPEPELVSAARDGDQRALDALVADSLPLVYNVVGRALRGHSDVDDVVQETMLRVVRGLAELRSPDSYRSWLIAIALRQARDHDRRRGAATARAVGYDQAREPVEQGSDFAGITILRLGMTDQWRDLAEATRWLDEEERELLSLWWLEASGKLDRSELADALGLSAPHAAVRVHRMKRQLDTARGVVRALRDTRACSGLRSTAAGWDGTPNALWRKRFARHVRACDRCEPQNRGLIPLSRLLHGLPLVPVPLSLSALPGGGASTGTAARPAGGHEHDVARSSHRAARQVRRLRPRTLVAAHPVAAVGVGMATAVALAASYVLVPRGQSATTVPLAAVTRQSPSTIPAPSTSGPKPSRSVSPVATTASPSPRATAVRTTTQAAVVAAPTTAQVATSSRKGVSAWSFSGVDAALADSGASWFYTWAPTPLGIAAPNVGFAPMIWGGSSVTASALAQAKQDTGCGCLLGFNEPDMASQSNMSVSQALSLWPQLEATGLTIGSPAVATGAATPGGWLDQFMTGAKQHGYRVDFITLHWYGSDFQTAAAVSQLQSYVEAVYTRYHLPIWLTEFALISYSGSTQQFPSESVQAAFLTSATQMLDALSYVQRYAWFALPAASSGLSSGLFQNGPAVTPVGVAFESAR